MLLNDCKECGGKGFLYDPVKGERLPCKCRVRAILRAYLSRLGVLTSPGPEVENWIRSGVTQPENLLFTFPQMRPSQVNATVALALLQVWNSTGVKRTYYYQNIYALVETYLEIRTDKSSVTAIREGLAILTRDGNEPENKTQGSLIRQLVSERARFGLPTWLILVGSRLWFPGVSLSFLWDQGFREIRWKDLKAQEPPEEASPLAGAPVPPGEPQPQEQAPVGPRKRITTQSIREEMSGRGVGES